MKTRVVNFFGGPGAGKSTLALQLMGVLKSQGRNCEYVPEFPKDLTWDRSYDVLDDQLFIFGEQHHRIYRLWGQVEWIVTDAPIIIQLYYFQQSLKKLRQNFHFPYVYRAFEDVIVSLHRVYDTGHNFVVERGNRKFLQQGRNQNEEESKAIDDNIQKILDIYKIEAPRVLIIDQVLDHLGLK